MVCDNIRKPLPYSFRPILDQVRVLAEMAESFGGSAWPLRQVREGAGSIGRKLYLLPQSAVRPCAVIELRPPAQA